MDEIMTNTLSALKKWEHPFPVKKTPATQGDANTQGNAKSEEAHKYFKLWSLAEDGLYPFGNNGQWHGGIHFDKNTGGQLEQESGVRCIADGEVIAYRVDRDYPVADFGDMGKAIYSSGFVLVRHRLQYPSELMPVPAAPTTPAAPANTPAASNPPANTASNAATPQSAAPNPPPRPEGPSLVLYSLYMHLGPWKNYAANPKLTHPKFWVSEALKREVGEKADDDNPGWNTPPGESATKGLNVRNSDRSQKIGWLPRGARLTLAPGNESDKWRQIASVEQGQMQFNPATNPGHEIAGWVYVQELETLASKPASFDTVYIPPKPLPIQAGEIVGHLGEYQRSTDARPSGAPSRPLIHLELFGGADVPAFIEQCRKLAAQLDDAKKPLIKIEVGAKLVQPRWHPDLELTPEDAFVLSANSPTEGPWVKIKRGTFEVVPRNQLPSPYKNQTYADGRILYCMVKQDGSEITEAQYNDLSAAEKQSYPKRKVLKPSDPAIWIERQHLGNVSQKIMRPTQKIRAWNTFPLQVGKVEMLPAAYTRIIDVKPLPSLKDDQGRQWWETTVGVGKNGRVKGWLCEKGHPKVKRCSPWEWPGFDFTALDKTTPLEWFKRKLANNYTPDNVLLKKLFETVDADKNGQLSPRELRFSWTIDWQIQALSRLVIEHESEWGQPISLWDELDNLLEKEAWEEEKKRIAKLQWWNQVKGQHGFPDSIQVHHFHPLAVIENFANTTQCQCKEITKELLKKIAPHASSTNIERYTDHIVNMFGQFGIVNCISKAHFLAQMLTESGSLQYTREQAANVSYDPWRGRGLIQITFRENYSAYGAFVGEDFISSQSAREKLENVPHSVNSAGWYWGTYKKLTPYSDEDDFIWCTARVNGGYNGYNDRLWFLNKAIKVLEMDSHKKKNHNGEYLFEESAVYKNAKFSFAWGLWHDPGNNQSGVTKSSNKALAGYRRYLALTNVGAREKKQWYYISQLAGHPEIPIKIQISVHPPKFEYDYRAYATARIQDLGGGQ
jgi:predicted chitinase